MKNDKFSHIDSENNPSMVNVTDKQVTVRSATARSTVQLTEGIMSGLEAGEIHSKKGPVFQTAIIAGTMAAKKTGELIPLCHPIGLDGCDFSIEVKGLEVIIECTATIAAKTGVEMEALTGASLAALTIYDMCKALSHNIVIKETRLIEKTGGKKDFRYNG
ncbi:MAG: cyclic pyranopterin monophosphate synthase MoaC [Reichenbachiella sp.]|uniref:cyclic pyranopterin monophosphate synthase MoaC n=1 Tax=Reichenbachiella sp. TaxID=2184521 RepID=UPI00329905A1